MGVCLQQYRACIGIFNSFRLLSLNISLRLSLGFLRNFFAFLNLTTCISYLFWGQYFYILFKLSLILLAGDIESNPGPREKENILSICHWNLNSVWVDNFSKIAQITAFLSVHKFDIFCIGESFLDSSIQDEDKAKLEIQNYELLRCDHPSNSRRGGVCLYYRDHLSVIQKPHLTTLDECLVCEVISGSKKLILCLLYRSPSQNSDEFEVFKDKLEETFNNVNNESPTISIFIGDFNVRNSDWWSGDITNPQGEDIGDLASRFDLHQIIDGPTHCRPGCSPSCIDLIFSSSRALVMDSGVLPSLYPRCHHQIPFVKVNFKVRYPPAYERRIWDFARADLRGIKLALDGIDWERDFTGLDVNGRVSLLSEYVTNIFSNFVPNKTIVIRDKDALWMTSEIKQMLLDKAKIYRRWKKWENPADGQALDDIAKRCTQAINIAKENYFNRLGNTLNDPNIGSKKYWSTLKQFLNQRKTPKIPPIRNERNVLVSDISEKASVFNSFFAKQCSLIETGSVLPLERLLTNTSLENIEFDEEKLVDLIEALNVNKAHGWDDISIRMVKIGGVSLVKPLINIFNLCIASGVFPSQWKKGNVVPVYKKGDKAIPKNYRPVSLLPVFGKLFEKCIYDALYSYFDSNNLFSPCQSGFREGDSCVSQLLSITHDIFKGFEANPSLDSRGVFLDISKAFDRVWHDGLIFKLKSYGVSGPLISLLQNFLSDRYQRVVLNGQSSEWKLIKAGVPQGSILGPLFFLIYINDLPDNLESKPKVFADDTSLFSIVADQQLTADQLIRDLNRISEWARQWKMSFNPDPSKQAVEVYFTVRLVQPNPPVISFNNTDITSSDYQKHLGLILDTRLSFEHHLEEKIKKANKGIGLINRLRKYVPRKSLLTLYKSYIRPHLDYADIIYDCPGNATFVSKLEKIQYNACLAITGCFRGTSREKLYSELGLESLSDRRYARRMIFFYKIVNKLTPDYLRRYLPVALVAPVNLRARNAIPPLAIRTERFRNTFFPFCISQWNLLDSRIRNLPSALSFKKAIFDFFRPKCSSVFGAQNSQGVIFLNRLRVGFSHLNDHKFRHGFLDTLDPLCSCRTNSIEDTQHYLLHCSNHSLARQSLFDNLHTLDIKFLPLSPSKLLRFLLYGDEKLDLATNRSIINFVIRFIFDSNRFSGPLY